MNLMLLCAGEGTRLRPHTLTLPKPAIPFLLAPMAAYGLEWAREIGIDRLCVNTFHLPQHIHELFKKLDHGAFSCAFSDEKTLLGNGGGIKKAQPFLQGDGHFLAMNGDEIFLPTQSGFLRQALQAHEKENRLATLFVLRHPDVGSKFGGVWTDPKNQVLGFGKTPTANSVFGWHYIGAAFFSDRIFDLMDEGKQLNILYDGVTEGLRRGEKVGIHEVQGWWAETGNPQDYLQGTKEALRLLENTTEPSTLFLRKVLDRHRPGWRFNQTAAASLLLDAEAEIAKDVEIEGFAVIGKKSRLLQGSRISNFVLGDGIELKSHQASDALLV